MTEKYIGPNFAKVYYRTYIEDPTRLITIYAPDAAFSHGEVASGPAGMESSAVFYGIQPILEQLEMIKQKQSKVKVAILHIEEMPTCLGSIMLLIGGYFLHESGPSRFVHSFILKQTSIGNNFVIINDCLRVYEKNCQSSIFSQDRISPYVAEVQQTESAKEMTNEFHQASLNDPSSKALPSLQKSEKKNESFQSKYEQSHENHSWCDDIEKHEEEEEKMREKENLIMLSKTVTSISIEKDIDSPDSEEPKALSTEEFQQDGLKKAFSYAQAAMKAASTPSFMKAMEAPKVQTTQIEIVSVPTAQKKSVPKEGSRFPSKENRSAGRRQASSDLAKSSSDRARPERSRPTRGGKKAPAQEKGSAKDSEPAEAKAKKN